MLYTRILWATLGAPLATAVWLMTTGSRVPSAASGWHNQAFSTTSESTPPPAGCVDLSPSSSAPSAVTEFCVPGLVCCPG